MYLPAKAMLYQRGHVAQRAVAKVRRCKRVVCKLLIESADLLRCDAHQRCKFLCAALPFSKRKGFEGIENHLVTRYKKICSDIGDGRRPVERVEDTCTYSNHVRHGGVSLCRMSGSNLSTSFWWDIRDCSRLCVTINLFGVHDTQCQDSLCAFRDSTLVVDCTPLEQNRLPECRSHKALDGSPQLPLELLPFTAVTGFIEKQSCFPEGVFGARKEDALANSRLSRACY